MFLRQLGVCLILGRWRGRSLEPPRVSWRRSASGPCLFRAKLWRSILLLSLLTTLLAASALAEEPRSLLVVVPEKMPLTSPQVERWVNLLKVERERCRLSADDAPIVRFSADHEQHRRVLRQLDVTSDSGVRTFLCHRDSRGWPTVIVREFALEMTAAQIFAELQEPAAPPHTLASTGVGATVGLLLVYSGGPPQEVETFLEELGRYWLQRYGRVRPSPYPLASYDVAILETETALRISFPELMQGEFPVAALCPFVDGRPVSVLSVFRDFQTPASLVREISSARGRVLGSAPSANQEGPPAPPPVQPLGLSHRQERWLLVSRVNENAQQLWHGARHDRSPKNEGPRRLLLRIIEESRRYLNGESEVLAPLRESLRDYAVEPLVEPPDSPLTGLSSRFFDLSQAVLKRESQDSELEETTEP